MRSVADRDSLLGVVTVNDWLRDEYVAGGIPAGKVCVWPSAVDLRPFRGLPDRKAARARLGIATSKPVATYCGHFYPEKGGPILVEAAGLAPEVEFRLVGGWPQDVAAMSCGRVETHSFL